MTKHHRRPRSRGGSNDPYNVSIVSESRHMAWHTLFNNKTIAEIVYELNTVWIDPSYELFIREKPGADKNQLSLFPNKKPR